ncbi:MAG TPA: hypothetical protein VNM14_21340 [Planctomycetota bacterium]|nr:hypothetical protein [Planctomycetota bacterium]
MKVRWLMLVLVALCLPACHGGSSKEIVPAPEGVEPVQPLAVEISWSQDVWPILLIRCQVCHTTGTGALQVPDMRMTDASTLYDEWVRVFAQCNPNFFRVYPGRRDLSFVYDKINHTAPLCGARMPLQGAPLDEAEQETIGLWIDQGAARN